MEKIIVQLHVWHLKLFLMSPGFQQAWTMPTLTFCHLQHRQPLSQAGSTCSYTFPRWNSYNPGLSHILGSPLQFRLYPQSLRQWTCRSCWQGIKHCRASMAFWKHGASFFMAPYFFACLQTSAVWITVSSAVEAEDVGCTPSTVAAAFSALEIKPVKRLP